MEGKNKTFFRVFLLVQARWRAPCTKVSWIFVLMLVIIIIIIVIIIIIIIIGVLLLRTIEYYLSIIA